MRWQEFLFSPLCLGCDGPLRGRRAFCFSCSRSLLASPSLLKEPAPLPLALISHAGAGRGLVQALRGSAPHLMAAWALSLLRRRGWLDRWIAEGVQLVVHAPQKVRSESSGLALLSLALAGRIKAEYRALAFRKSEGHSQHGRSLTQRVNSRPFLELALPSGAVEGRHVLVLDDVLTTGTTLDLCAYQLRKAGAAKVSRFALTHQVVQGLNRKNEQANEEGDEIDPFLFHLFVEVGKEIARGDVKEGAGGNSERGTEEKAFSPEK